MKYLDEFRDKKIIASLSSKLAMIMPKEEIKIMEVCGSHTHSFFRFGLHRCIPPGLKLIAGPGCPVCVSPQQYIDAAIKISKVHGVIVVTFADMVRVPGSEGSLERSKTEGANVLVVYSPWQVINIAQRYPHSEVVFLAVGFETTAPTIALTIKEAKRRKIKNLSFLCALRRIIPAMEYLLNDKDVQLDAFLCPGHVSTVIGSRAYEVIVSKYRRNCCIAGFEPVDILQGLYLLVKNISAAKVAVTNQYKRAVKKEGNPHAQAIIDEVFGIEDSMWRGLGFILRSGYALRERYKEFCAYRRFGIPSLPQGDFPLKRCRCGDVLKGIMAPYQCPLFGKACNPQYPQGPCMVSSEGACSAYHRYDITARR